MAEKRSDVNESEDTTGALSNENANENNGESFGGDTGKIKDQIEETRSQMGETIDAIQDKLSFSNVSEQVSEHVNHAVDAAKEAVYDATVGKAVTFMKELGSEVSGSSVVNIVRNNPLPFILIGAGAGLLAYQSYNRKDDRKSDLKRINRYKSSGTSGRNMGETGSSQSGAGDKISGVAGQLSDTAGNAYGKLTDTAALVYEGTGQKLGVAYDKLGELGSAAGDQYNKHIEENPLAVGAVALALGAAVGMAIPSTQYEGKLLGGTKQSLMNKAEEAAAGLIDKTKEAVTNASESVSDQLNSETTH